MDTGNEDHYRPADGPRDALKSARRRIARLEGEVESLEETINEWKEASGLMIGGDPSDVEPEHLRADLGKREVELDKANERITELEGAYTTADAEAAGWATKADRYLRACKRTHWEWKVQLAEVELLHALKDQLVAREMRTKAENERLQARVAELEEHQGFVRE